MTAQDEDQATDGADRRRGFGLLGAVAGGATGLVQSVANRVAPGVVESIDMDEIVQRTDVQALVDRVDVEELLARIDVNELLDRMDVERLLDRIDVNRLLERIDIDAIVGRTEIGPIVARSTAGAFAGVVDVVRSQGVTMDDAVHRWVDRVLRRPPADPPGPGVRP